MSEFLKECKEKLERGEKLVLETPPGEIRARLKWIQARMREMIMIAENRERAGLDISLDEKNLKFILNKLQ